MAKSTTTLWRSSSRKEAKGTELMDLVSCHFISIFYYSVSSQPHQYAVTTVFLCCPLRTRITKTAHKQWIHSRNSLFIKCAQKRLPDAVRGTVHSTSCQTAYLLSSLWVSLIVSGVKIQYLHPSNYLYGECKAAAD